MNWLLRELCQQRARRPRPSEVELELDIFGANSSVVVDPTSSFNAAARRDLPYDPTLLDLWLLDLRRRPATGLSGRAWPSTAALTWIVVWLDLRADVC